MSIKKFVAAAVAVLGMAGMASAQGSVGISLPGTIAPGPTSGEIGVSYNVTLQASMTVTNRTLKDDGLFAASLSDLTGSTNAGNLGIVVVKTNYPRWDVEVQAKNGLKLCLPGTETVTPSPWPGGADTKTNNPGAALKASATGDTVDARLAVYIGVINSTNNGYENTNPTSFNAALGTLNQKTSIAKIIGTEWGSSYKFKQVVDATTGQGGDEIANATTGGFGAQLDPVKGITFLITGALVKDGGASFGTPTTQTLLSKTTLAGRNESGNYTETLTFTLVAGF